MADISSAWLMLRTNDTIQQFSTSFHLGSQTLAHNYCFILVEAWCPLWARVITSSLWQHNTSKRHPQFQAMVFRLAGPCFFGCCTGSQRAWSMTTTNGIPYQYIQSFNLLLFPVVWPGFPLQWLYTAGIVYGIPNTFPVSSWYKVAAISTVCTCQITCQFF